MRDRSRIEDSSGMPTRDGASCRTRCCYRERGPGVSERMGSGRWGQGEGSHLWHRAGVQARDVARRVSKGPQAVRNVDRAQERSQC